MQFRDIGTPLDTFYFYHPEPSCHRTFQSFEKRTRMPTYLDDRLWFSE